MLRKALRICPQALLAATLLLSVPHLAWSEAVTNESASGAANGSASGTSGGSQASQTTGGSLNGETNGDNGAASAESKSTAGASSGTAAAEGQTATTSAAVVQDGVSSAQSQGTAAVEAGDKSVTVGAKATATYGGSAPNSAAAETTVNGQKTTSAKAVRGQSAAASTYGDPNGYTEETVNDKKTVAIAIRQDGTYSMAIASTRGSYASSGVASGNFATFTGRDLYSAVRAAVEAFAQAERDFAEAEVSARASGETDGGGVSMLSRSSSGGSDWAGVNVRSSAYACVGERCRPQEIVAQMQRMQCTWSDAERTLECPHANWARAEDSRYTSMGR